MADNRRVLIVDDDIDFADSLHDILETENYLTHIANNTNDALAGAETFGPHVALLDIRLGQASGLDLLTELKQKYPHLLCIIMTAYANVETAVRALQYGAYDYLHKPVYPEELTATLHRCFEKIELEQKNQQTLTNLQASEERYRSIFENALEGIFRYIPKEGFIDANPALIQMLGYTTKEEVLALNPKEDVYVNNEQFQYVRDHIQAGKIIENLKLTWKKKNGEHIIINLNSQVVQDDQGEILLCESMAQDITERHRVEEEIQGRNRELTLLNRVIAASATSLDAESVLETACREIALAFDVPQASASLVNQEEAATTIVAEFKGEDQSTILNEQVSLANNPLAQYLIEHKAPLMVSDAQNDARLVSIHHLLRQRNAASILILPLIIEDEVIGTLSLATNETRSFSPEEIKLGERVANQITGALARIRLDQKNRRLEERHRQGQKMEAIGRLAGGMAHDFNNLLTVITGYSELLLHRHMDKDSPQFREVEQIHRAGERASALTRQLLAFSRQQVIQPEILNLNEIITDMNKMLRRLVSEDIELIIDLDPVLNKIKADSGQIEQVIMNLTVNASDAMPQGGQLTTHTENIDLTDGQAGLPAGAYILLSISDTGIGMDDETQARIFDPFFTTKGKGKGTGLGLSTVYGIIQQNQGNINVSSQPESGTTFEIYLPVFKEENATVTQSHQVAVETPQGQETILLVEDEDMVRDLARYALQQNGYRVLEAHNGQQALKICQEYQKPIDLLLTDVIMPGGLSGPNLAAQVVTIRPGIKVLYVSGYVDNGIVKHGVLDTDVEFLQKPFSPVALAQKVRKVLDS